MKIHRSPASTSDHRLENHLFDAIASIRTAEEAQQFFRDLCTPNEIQAMADRWLVVGEIKKNKSYRQIYDATGVSIATIGRVARSMMFGEGGYSLIFERFKKKVKK